MSKVGRVLLPRKKCLNGPRRNRAVLKCRASQVQSEKLEVSPWQCCIHYTNYACNSMYCSTGALCRAAYDGGNPTAVAEAISSLGQMDEVEIESFKDLLKRFGCK